MSGYVGDYVEPAAAKWECVETGEHKPDSDVIKGILKTHYDSIAEGFDEFNSKISRKKYINAVDQFVAERLSNTGQLQRVLSIGAGTGYREASILEMSKRSYEITCVDQSSKMCKEASAKGLTAICSFIDTLNLEPEVFDACIYLNAFEALDNGVLRTACLHKLWGWLKPESPLFLDVVNINAATGWGAKVRKHFEDTNMAYLGYDLGDVFYRRTDNSTISFMHCYSAQEVEELFHDTGYEVLYKSFLDEETGSSTDERGGRVLFMAIKKLQGAV